MVFDFVLMTQHRTRLYGAITSTNPAGLKRRLVLLLNDQVDFHLLATDQYLIYCHLGIYSGIHNVQKSLRRETSEREGPEEGALRAHLWSE